MMLIAACDPGARESGLCLVEFLNGHKPDVIAAHVVCRIAGESDQRYVNRVADAVIDYAQDGAFIAIESVVKPSPYVGQEGKLNLLDPTSLFRTSEVIGAIYRAAGDREVRLVRPARNDGGTDAPAELIGDREGPALKGIARHSRSAYSVAVKAHAQLVSSERATT